MALVLSIWNDFRHVLRNGSMTTRLVMVNFLVFLLVNCLYVGLWLSLGTENQVHYTTLWTLLDYFCLPSDWHELLRHPWTPLSSIFLHQGFWHMLSNLVWLYLFGTIISDLIGNRRVFPVYLLGGLAGGLAYFVSAQFSDSPDTHALGASAAVMAMSGAALVMAPDYRVMLFALGEIRLKYIVLVMVLLDLVGFANQDNTGGHAAHIGGFAMGILFVFRLRDGHDMAEPINRFFDRIGATLIPGRPKTARGNNQPPLATHKRAGKISPEEQLFQEKVQLVLDKMKRVGYDQLSPEEKEILFQASKK